MFDCVLAAGGRFLVSLTLYGVCHLTHWLPIAAATTATIGFLVGKVLKFSWHAQPPITYNVFLVLLSFVLTWAEVWFFDLRMIPLERKAAEIWGEGGKEGGAGAEEERQPLLGGGAGPLVRYMR